MLKALATLTAAAMGLAAVANGLFMLTAPQRWYLAVPGVTTTGPFNQHFIRDIGLIFLLLGSSYVVGAAKPNYRLILWAAPTTWLCGHALFQLWEIMAGISAHSAMARDFPAVTLPAVLGLLLTFWAAGYRREVRRQSAPDLQRN